MVRNSSALESVPKRSRGERTRAALIAAADERFRELGFEKATTGEIARQAGVAEGTLFLHFGSKTGLLLSVMQAYYDTLVEDLAEEASRGATPTGRLHHLVRFWLGRVSRDWRLMRTFGQHGRFSDDPEIVARFAQMNRQVTRFFGGIFEDLKAIGAIRQDLPTYLLCDALFGTAEHLLLGIDNTGRERDLGEAANHLCGLLLGNSAKSGDREAPSLATIDAKLDALQEALLGSAKGSQES